MNKLYTIYTKLLITEEGVLLLMVGNFSCRTVNVVIK